MERPVGASAAAAETLVAPLKDLSRLPGRAGTSIIIDDSSLAVVRGGRRALLVPVFTIARGTADSTLLWVGRLVESVTRVLAADRLDRAAAFPNVARDLEVLVERSWMSQAPVVAPTAGAINSAEATARAAVLLQAIRNHVDTAEANDKGVDGAASLGLPAASLLHPCVDAVVARRDAEVAARATAVDAATAVVRDSVGCGGVDTAMDAAVDSAAVAAAWAVAKVLRPAVWRAKERGHCDPAPDPREEVSSGQRVSGGGWTAAGLLVEVALEHELSATAACCVLTESRTVVADDRVDEDGRLAAIAFARALELRADCELAVHEDGPVVAVLQSTPFVVPVKLCVPVAMNAQLVTGLMLDVADACALRERMAECRVQLAPPRDRADAVSTMLRYARGTQAAVARRVLR